MRERIPKRFDSLSSDTAIAARLNERDGRHQWHLNMTLVEKFGDSEERGFGVKRIENSLDQQHIGAAVDQAARLFVVGVHQFVKSHAARRRAVDIRRDRTGSIRGTDGARYEA